MSSRPLNSKCKNKNKQENINKVRPTKKKGKRDGKRRRKLNPNLLKPQKKIKEKKNDLATFL